MLNVHELVDDDVHSDDPALGMVSSSHQYQTFGAGGRGGMLGSSGGGGGERSRSESLEDHLRRGDSGDRPANGVGGGGSTMWGMIRPYANYLKFW